MSAVVVGGSAAAVVGLTGVLAVREFTLAKWMVTGSPEAKAQEQRDMMKAGLYLGGVLGLGALLYYKSSHPDVGKGIALGVGGILAVLAYDRVFPESQMQKPAAWPAPSAAQPAPVTSTASSFFVLPPSNDFIARTEDPPAAATVGPPGFVATFSGFTVAPPGGTLFTMNGPVPQGTLLADLTTAFVSDNSSGNSAGTVPVVWVSPDGERLAYVHKSTMFIPGLTDGQLLIAHKMPRPSGGSSFPSFSL